MTHQSHQYIMKLTIIKRAPLTPIHMFYSLVIVRVMSVTLFVGMHSAGCCGEKQRELKHCWLWSVPKELNVHAMSHAAQHTDCIALHRAVNAKAESGWSTSCCIYLTLPCPLASYSCPLPTTTAAHITTATLVFPLWVHLPAEKGSCRCNPTPWSTPMGILVFPVPSIFSMKFLCLTAFHKVEQRRGG